jgi:hypothetical protein
MGCPRGRRSGAAEVSAFDGGVALNAVESALKDITRAHRQITEACLPFTRRTTVAFLARQVNADRGFGLATQ